jgi:membrane protein required for colicin V production
LTLFDLFILAVMALSVLFGALRGLLREAITLVALGAGLVMVSLFGTPLAQALGAGLGAIAALLLVLFAAGFIAAHIILEIAARKLTGPSPRDPDRIAGGLFGFLRGWLLCGLAYLMLTYYYDAARLPEPVSGAALKGFAAGAAALLDRLGVEGEDESREDQARWVPPVTVAEG